MAKVPLVDSTIRTEFGDVLDDPAFYDVGAADRDLTYVPGFSDMRRARDLELAAVASKRKQPHEAHIAPLPVNCRWYRATDVRGAPDGRKQIAAGNDGYRAVTQKDVGQAWLTKLPPGASVGADGSIRKGDTILMVVDGKQAAHNAARKVARTNAMERAARDTADGLLRAAARTKGVDPYIEQLPAEKTDKKGGT